MVREYYRKIIVKEDVRANLISLRDALKEEKNRRAFAYLLGGEFSQLSALLQDQDPKVRRNAALILGQMESEDLLPVLFAAYEKEETLFVRADYLKAIAQMDYQKYVDRLEQHLEELRMLEPGKESQKHISEEMRALQNMIMKYRKVQHKFIGERTMEDVILVTNRCQREATARQLKTGKITLLAGGVRVREARLKELLPIRTYSEMLFPLETGVLHTERPEIIGQLVCRPLLQKVRGLHEGEDAYPFRIELKSRIPADKKGVYIRKISDALEKASGGSLVNSVTDYELELRLLEKKDGTLVPMLKLYTIPDRRFTYRKEMVASSIAPVNAALTAELARPWLKEGAQVLDPFCGVGTMLLERNYAVSAGVMYGIDIFGEAIEKARNNTDRTDGYAYYINKDFLEFEHEYLFDEVITNLPQATTAKPKEEIRALYRTFLQKLPVHLKSEAVLVFYAAEAELLEAELKRADGYCIEKKFLLNEKNGTSVFIVFRN